MKTWAKTNQAQCWPLPVARLTDPNDRARFVNLSIWWPKGKPYPTAEAYKALAGLFRERFGEPVPKDPRRLSYRCLDTRQWTFAEGSSHEDQAETRKWLEQAGLDHNYQPFEVREHFEHQFPDYIGACPDMSAMTLWLDDKPFDPDNRDAPKRKPKAEKAETVRCQFCGSKLKVPH
jgi:hypothetical protein